MTVNIVRNYLNEADFQIESVDALVNSRNIADLGEMYIQSYYGGWQATVDGPKGGHYVHTTGGTASAPTVGTPVSVGTIGTGVQVGYYWDLDGVEWRVSENNTITPYIVGAVGDGTDELAQLESTNTLATAMNKPLVLPSGSLFGLDGLIQPSTDVIGYGATLQQLRATPNTTNVEGVFYILAQSGLTVEGVTIDGNFTTTGVGVQNCDNITIKDVIIQNVINGGIMCFTSSWIKISNTRILDIRYSTIGIAGAAADGCFFGGCNQVDVEYCYVYRPRRIGFVCDASGPVKCNNMRYFRCVTEEAHNCDESTTEFNAAFWAENTNSVDWIEMVGINIASGVGQTSGRVKGGQVLAIGNDAEGVANCTECRMVENTARLVAGFAISGSGSFATVYFENNKVHNVSSGCTVGDGARQISIKNFSIDDINASASQGGVLVFAPSDALDFLVIDNITEQNAVYDADSGTINFFDTPANVTYTLKNSHDITHVMRSSATKVIVEASSVASMPTSFGTFLAQSIVLSGSDFYDRNGAGTALRFITGARPAGATTSISNCTLSQILWDESVSDSKLYLSNSVFDACQIQINSTSNFAKLDGITSRNSGTNGFIYTNFNVPTDQTLIVMNCHFETTDLTFTPLNRRNQNPTVTVLHNNTYNTTVLHDFTVTTSVVNNIMV